MSLREDIPDHDACIVAYQLFSALKTKTENTEKLVPPHTQQEENIVRKGGLSVMVMGKISDSLC
ncbi:hypothetical protein ACLOJK_032299 [Asimina triloba]